MQTKHTKQVNLYYILKHFLYQYGCSVRHTVFYVVVISFMALLYIEKKAAPIIQRQSAGSSLQRRGRPRAFKYGTPGYGYSMICHRPRPHTHSSSVFRDICENRELKLHIIKLRAILKVFTARRIGCTHGTCCGRYVCPLCRCRCPSVCPFVALV